MDVVVWTYGVYLVVSVQLMVWVARTLFVNGRVFLVDVFRGDEALGDSVNRLLVVGFYLINLGYISLTLRVGYNPTTARGDRGTLGEDRVRAARARVHALLQPVRPQPCAPIRQQGQDRRGVRRRSLTEHAL